MDNQTTRIAFAPADHSRDKHCNYSCSPEALQDFTPNFYSLINMEDGDAKMEKFLALKAEKEKRAAERNSRIVSRESPFRRGPHPRRWKKMMREKGLEPTDSD